MKVICAWCKKVLRIGTIENGVSHGICPECAQKMIREANELRANK